MCAVAVRTELITTELILGRNEQSSCPGAQAKRGTVSVVKAVYTIFVTLCEGPAYIHVLPRALPVVRPVLDYQLAEVVIERSNFKILIVAL